MPMFIWGCSFSFSFRLVIGFKCWWVSVTEVILKKINMTTYHQHWPPPRVCSLPGAPLHIHNCVRLEKLKSLQHLVFPGGLPSKQSPGPTCGCCGGTVRIWNWEPPFYPIGRVAAQWPNDWCLSIYSLWGTLRPWVTNSLQRSCNVSRVKLCLGVHLTTECTWIA